MILCTYIITTAIERDHHVSTTQFVSNDTASSNIIVVDDIILDYHDRWNYCCRCGVSSLDGIQQEKEQEELVIVVYSKFSIVVVVVVVVVIAKVVLFRLQWNYTYI